MLNDTIVDFLKIVTSKIGIKLDFWMVNILKNYVQAILYKTKTDFWTYISKKRLKIPKLLFCQIFALQMCVKWKKVEGSIIFLIGDIQMLVPALYKKFWLYLPCRLYFLQVKNKTPKMEFSKFTFILGLNVDRNSSTCSGIWKFWYKRSHSIHLNA
jgi:hypothetical protein